MTQLLNKNINAELIKACRDGNYELINLLLDQGANINYIDDNGDTPLTIACSKNFVEIAELLLEDCSSRGYVRIDHIKKTSGKTALMEACENGFIEIVQLLLDKGANADLADDNDDTPLTIACSKNLVEIAALLLQEECIDRNGVNACHIKKTSGKTALIEASENGSLEIVELLLYYSSPCHTAFISAYKNNHIEIAKLLLESITRQNITYIDQYDTVFLRNLPKDDYIDIVTFLLKNNIDLHKNDTTGHTTLMYAAQDDYIDLVKLLLKNDTHLNKQSKNGHTALIYAAKNNNTDIATLLLNNGADVNTANEDGNTALIQACRYKSSIEIIKLLLNKGANIKTINKHGKTALAIAQDKGFDNIVKLLSEHR